MPKRYSEAICSVEPKTFAEKLRDDMPTIDRKLRNGGRYEDIIAALKSEGLEIKRTTLHSLVQRYRAKNKAQGDPGSLPVQPDRKAVEIPRAPEPDTDEPTSEAPLPPRSISKMLNHRPTLEEAREERRRAYERKLKRKSEKDQS